MSCFRPPFQGAQPGWEDGCGFAQQSPPANQTTNEQRGGFVIPIGSDRVQVNFNPVLVLGTDYDIEVWTENKKTGDPDEQIYPTLLIQRMNDGTNETGFLYQLNSAPTTGDGTLNEFNQANSYIRFNWKIKWYA